MEEENRCSAHGSDIGVTLSVQRRSRSSENKNTFLGMKTMQRKCLGLVCFLVFSTALSMYLLQSVDGGIESLLSIETVRQHFASDSDESVNETVEASGENVILGRIPDKCKLLRKGKGPLPVILLAMGRSGSSILWSTISELTGQRNIAWEYTGSNLNSSKAFLNALEKGPHFEYDWPSKKLCYIQQYRSDISPVAGIFGFQWKPYMTSFNHEYAIEGLKEIASHRYPTIKMIYLRRNALDKKASNLRHANSKIGGSAAISAHCAIGDKACFKKNLKYDKNICFPTGEELMRWLRTTTKNDNAIRKRLIDLNIQFVEVTYEKLFNPTVMLLKSGCAFSKFWV